MSGKFQQAAGRELTRLVIVKAPRLSLEQFEHTGYYDELTRAMSQTEQKGPDILDQVMSVVRNLSSLIGYGAVLWVIHPFILTGVAGTYRGVYLDSHEGRSRCLVCLESPNI